MNKFRKNVKENHQVSFFKNEKKKHFNNLKNKTKIIKVYFLIIAKQKILKKAIVQNYLIFLIKRKI